MRRVVTGHTSDGKAAIASDTEVDAITITQLPGMDYYKLWGADKAPTFPDDGSHSPERAKCRLKYVIQTFR